MIDDLDSRLARIASATMTDDLAGLEDVVLRRVAIERAQAASARRIGVAAVVAASLIGGLGSLDRGAPAAAAGPIDALGGAGMLAPSTLLGGS